MNDSTQRSHCIIDGLASPPVRYSCRWPHPLPDSESSIHSKRGSDPPGHATRRSALLQVRNVDRTLHGLSLKSPRSVICAVTLTLTVMIVSANQSVRNITAQYASLLFTLLSPFSRSNPSPLPSRLATKDSNYGTPEISSQAPSLSCSCSHAPLPTSHSLTVAMMSRITLHLKRFAHSTTTIDSEDTRFRRPHGHLRQQVFEISTLRASPPAAFPSAYSQVESFPLESLLPSATAGADTSVPIDLHPLNTLTAMGDEELAGSPGCA